MAIFCSNRLAILKDGSLVFCGTAAELTAKSGSGTVYPQVNAVEVNATYQDWEYFFE